MKTLFTIYKETGLLGSSRPILVFITLILFSVGGGQAKRPNRRLLRSIFAPECGLSYSDELETKVEIEFKKLKALRGSPPYLVGGWTCA